MGKNINIKLVFKIIGFLLILEACFILLALIPSAYFQEGDFFPLLYSGVITLFFGLLLWFSFKRKKQGHLGKKEGYVVVSTAWLIYSVFGALPFLLSGTTSTYTDAFFEAMSGITTTGATILTDIEAAPKGVLFWRSITQWIGGMGIIVLSLVLLPILGIGGISLFIAEIPGPTKEKIHPRIIETAKRLWLIYFLLTAIQAVLMKFGGLNWYDSVCHAFTTMATGGFSTKNDSIAAFAPHIQYIIIMFMIIGGTNFVLTYFMLKGRFSKLYKNEEFRFYILVLAVISVIIFIPLIFLQNMGIEEAFRTATFQVVSITTTTGYITADYMQWNNALWFIIFLLFFTGACAGSTSGGFKMVRQLLLIKNSSLELKRLIHPNAVIPVRFNGKPVSQELIYNVLAFFLFYMIIFAFSSLAMSLFPVVDFKTAIGAAASCLGNIGPGIGMVGPVENFSFLPDAAKWYLSFLMMVGRLEIFTVIILFAPGFWKN